MQSNFAHCANFPHARKFANFYACAKLPTSNFRPKTTPFCIFSNFTPNVITIDMGILVFHFFVRLYIAILCTVDGTDFLVAGEEILGREGLQCSRFSSSLPFSLIFSPFLGCQTPLEDDNSRDGWLKLPHP